MARRKPKGPVLGFVEQANNGRVEEAKKLLLERGFSVSDPLQEEDLKHNLLSLASFFYQKMSEKYSSLPTISSQKTE